MPNKVRVQAKDVSSAIAQGLKDLGLRRDQAEVTVLESPKKGFLGFGAKPAVVEVRQKRWSSSDLDSQIYMDVPKKKKPTATRSRSAKPGKREERGVEAREEKRDDTKRRGGRKAFVRGTTARRHGEEPREKLPKANEPQLLPSLEIQNTVVPESLTLPMQEAKQYLEQVLTHMGVKVENLNVWWDEKQQRILLTFDCDHPAIVIGKEGKTLEAIQYLSTLALSRHFDKPISVITDTQNYWRKAEDKINAEIEKGLALIEAGHSVFRFRPMSAQLRRYIHRALEGSTLVSTFSEGEGKWRKVTLRSKSAKLTEQNEPELNGLEESQTKQEADQTKQNEPEQTPAQPLTQAPIPAEQNRTEQAFTACECEDISVAPVPQAAAVLKTAETVLEQVKEMSQQAHQSATVLAEQDTLATQIDAIVDEQTEGVCTGSCSSCSCCGVEAPAVTVEAAPEAVSAPSVVSVPAEPDNNGGTCSVEIARNCAEEEPTSGCACGPLFEAPQEADETNPK